MFSCDYNGWADVPEEEREGLDAFEGPRFRVAPVTPVIRGPVPPTRIISQRRAA